MKIYEVGGCVRDRLLGLEPKDIDYVVVGSNSEEMLSLGYHQVGKDFPVFLNPQNNSEYALARTERKTSAGYGGFTVNSDGVTLEEDLYRRDLTMNAMAMDKNGNLIDPYNGKTDLQNKLIRHVSEHFSEDPLRVLRAARFAARYNFTIAPETITLMKDLARSGELSALVKERVWAETEKVLTGGGDPSIYFEELMKSNSLESIYKVKFVDIETISDISQNKNLNSVDKFNMIYLLVYSNPEVLSKIDDFDVNKINWSEYGNKGKQVDYPNKSMYSPSSFTRMRDQLGAVINFGIYYDKSAEERLQLIKILRASQNKDTVAFMYDCLTNFTSNEILMDIMQTSKQVFLNDIKLLENIDYNKVRAGCAAKEISSKMEAAQLDVLKDSLSFVNELFIQDTTVTTDVKKSKKM